jgi:hypothetical protein
MIFSLNFLGFLLFLVMFPSVILFEKQTSWLIPLQNKGWIEWRSIWRGFEIFGCIFDAAMDIFSRLCVESSFPTGGLMTRTSIFLLVSYDCCWNHVVGDWINYWSYMGSRSSFL